MQNPVAQYIEVGSGVPIEDSDNLVEFHLLYSGPLHSAGHALARKEKHSIRQAFHSQLKHLWATNPNLRRRAEVEGRHAYAAEIHGNAAAPQVSPEEAIAKGLHAMAAEWSRNGFNFLPLVTRILALRCSLEILFLRVEEKNYVLQGGDIDGRLKILFDAMRMTDNAGELPTGAAPGPDENPFYCLLENDDLISEVRVNTDQLLLLPGSAVRDKHDVYLQITVKLNVATRFSTPYAVLYD
jgi:hypothetical protein